MGLAYTQFKSHTGRHSGSLSLYVPYVVYIITFDDNQHSFFVFLHLASLHEKPIACDNFLPSPATVRMLPPLPATFPSNGLIELLDVRDVSTVHCYVARPLRGQFAASTPD